MLVVDVDALAAIHVLYLVDDVAQDVARAAEMQQVVRVHRTFGELLADLDGDAVSDARTHAGAARDRMRLLVSVLVDDRELAALVGVFDLELTSDLGKDRLAFRLARLEELGDTRQAVRDVLAGDATGMERTHGQLRSRFTDRLSGDDADRGSDVDRAAACQVPPVARLTDAVLGVAGHDRTTR